jgi:hypothetical protein
VQSSESEREVEMGDRVEVSELPPCDFNAAHKKAWVDGKTKMGYWANMCQQCYKSYGVGLGTGFGQRLILKGKK